MHLPWTALAGVDTVEMAAPARNRVATAAARVALDADVIFMGVLFQRNEGACPARAALRRDRGLVTPPTSFNLR
jgi:hypothetical protein